MLKNRILQSIFLAISLLLMNSCSEYEKILKSNDPEFKYRKAMEYYNNKEYARASTIFEQIINIYRASSKGDSVSYYFAKSYYEQEDYLMAGHYFSEFSEVYPRSPFAEEADYMAGYCNYNMSPKPSLDQTYSKTAIQQFNKFQYKHPESKYVPECKRITAELNNKLVEKTYMGAKLYFNLGYYKASMVALRNCISDYPDSKYREELMFLIVKSNFLYAENSVPEKRNERYQATIDEYYSFIGEYPESNFKKDVDKIYNKTKEYLGL
jgi:outer membrane protein assembly factor BamD